MNLRLAILALSDKYGLSDGGRERLRQLAGLDQPPPSLAERMPLGSAILGAALGGLGVLFWIAANWASLPLGGDLQYWRARWSACCSGPGTGQAPGSPCPCWAC